MQNYEEEEDDDDKRPDYFEDDDYEEPVKVKKPVYKPEDPRYWTESSDRWDHIRMARPPKKIWIWAGASFITLILILSAWIRYFKPYVVGATQSGYVEQIERRGDLFHTYEGVLLPYRDLMDSSKVYQRDFVFSVENTGVAATIKRLMLAGKPVRVEYKRYHAALPWKGSSPIVVVKADSVDPSLLLPIDNDSTSLSI